MDGNELARRLRSHPETAKAIIIAITGYGPEQINHAANNAGFDYYFVKPLDADKLLKLLSDIRRR
jgi:CheY-like chemotaxis protein